MYYNVNNLYGWMICQPLPYAEFRWVEDAVNFDEGDHSGFTPFLHFRGWSWVSTVSTRLIHWWLSFCPTYDKPPGKREDKLLALYDKQRYIIYYRNLQQCIRHDLRVTKIRVLQFAQSPWLREYIELNTNFRIRAENNFEKNLYKLMNNAVFSKTMENVRNYVDVKLVTKWDGTKRRQWSQNRIFHSRSVFAENLIAIKLRKLEVKFNKPIYVSVYSIHLLVRISSRIHINDISRQM